MGIKDIDDLLQKGEGQRLEFKEEAIKPGDLAETLVALANAQGGIVLVGVDDSAQPVGLKYPNQALDLAKTAASHELCDPPVRLKGIELVALPNGTQVLALSVPRSRHLHATHGRFLARRGSRNVALTTSEVAERARRLDTGGLAPLQIGGGYGAVYEVLHYHATLELSDSQGNEAMLERDQEIRFLQDGVIGLYHQAWGAGELFADFQVEPGVVADRFRLGSRHFTLISFREVKNRGDTLRLHIRRQIKEGWTEPDEWLETTVNHRTRQIRITIVFPVQRPPLSAFLMEEATGVTKPLEREHWQLEQ